MPKKARGVSDKMDPRFGVKNLKQWIVQCIT
jgi:hypothetical protein